MNYPWYMRLIGSLNCYFKIVKQITSLVNCAETSTNSKVASIKMLLVTFEEDLIEAEREVISKQFNQTEDDVLESFEKVQAGNIECNLFLN